MLVQTAVRKRFLNRFYYPVSVGQISHQRIYASMRKAFYWSHIANDLYNTVSNCLVCAYNSNRQRSKRKMQLISASEPLDIKAIGILELLPRSKKNHHVIVITGRSRKLNGAARASSTNTTHVSNVFFELWIIPHGFPTHVVKDEGVQFTRNPFRNTIHDTWGKTPGNYGLQPTDRQKRQKLQSNDSPQTSALRRGKPA